jgi:hypothetical protein
MARKNPANWRLNQRFCHPQRLMNVVRASGESSDFSDERSSITVIDLKLRNDKRQTEMPIARNTNAIIKCTLEITF